MANGPQGGISYRLSQNEKAIERLEKRLDDHIGKVDSRFETQAKERAQEQKEALTFRQTEQKWKIGTALTAILLVISAFAVLLNALGGA